VTHDVIVLLSALAVVGQMLVGAGIVIGLLAAFRVRGPLDFVRGALWGYELWAGFLVASIATGGSLFLSEVARFIPCELCWYQRICMYPLSIILLLAALADDHRVARYLLPLPIVGAGVSVYHILIERGVIEQSTACLVSAPGGCATKWVNEFGYVTIPVMALTAFLLLLGLLTLAATGGGEGSTLSPDGER
jgi:disulfide bond formation protein DsbB